jgi:nitroreductase
MKSAVNPVTVELCLNYNGGEVPADTRVAYSSSEAALQAALSASPGGHSTADTAAPVERGLARRIRRAIARRFIAIYARLDASFLRLSPHSRLLAWVYYSLWSRSFGREQRAVLAGRLRFRADAARPNESAALLRRGIHRLEKGLLMRPRREIFALDYIVETFDCYTRLLENAGSSDSAAGELQWAHDVLHAYFHVVRAHPKIDPLRERFAKLPALHNPAPAPCVPYKRDLTGPPAVNFEALMQLARRRRSVRWFLPHRVPRELLKQAVELAGQSPSACNRQPFVFRIFDEPEMAQRVAAIPAGTAGFAHNFPAVVVVVGRLRAYFDERDRHVIYLDGALASMSFVFALETLGLSSCCINWPDIEEREQQMARTLQLEPDERPIMLIAVGYPDPDGLVAFSQKKPVEQLCRFNLE